jgi:predicted dehydrogenase
MLPKSFSCDNSRAFSKMQPIRWGMVGTGRMAATFAGELATFQPTDAILAAVVSRDYNKAQAFAQRHGIPRCHADTAALLQDPGIDAVYLATPHPRHAPGMLEAIAHGKAVLCEKPFTINAVDAAAVIAAARSRGVFVMEALWSRFLPAVRTAREWLAAGRIGQVSMLVGGGAFMPDRNADHYLLDPQRGGGVLLDAGVYLVSLSSMLLGPPSRIQCSGQLGPTGVDEQTSLLLEHPGGASACLYVSLHARRSPDLEVLGSQGRLRITAPIFRPTRLLHWDASGVETTHEFPIEGSGYRYQIEAVNRALREGRTECPEMPLDESLSIMRTLDAARMQMGLKYPAEAQ